MKIEIINAGLELTLEGDENEEIADNDRDYWANMSELFEPTMCNGSFTHFDASTANPFVGLTSAPCVAEGMGYDDEGKASIEGRFWYFADYALRDDLAELIAGKTVVYTMGPRD